MLFLLLVETNSRKPYAGLQTQVSLDLFSDYQLKLKALIEM